MPSIASLPSIALVDHTNQDPHLLQEVAAALQIQALRDFAQASPGGWGLGATVRVAAPSGRSAPRPGEWVLSLLPEADQPDALGYHDETADNVPLLKVFPTLDAQDGTPWSVTASHEVLEALADPLLGRCVQAPDGRIWALETCLAGETKVPIGDGSMPTIAELAQRGGSFVVYATNTEGRVVRAEGRAARRTGVDREVVRVRMTNGTSVRCTPEHRFLLADGTYREARDLTPGTQLFSEMRPGFASAHSVDCPEGHAVSFREDCRGVAAGSDGHDRLVGQLGASMGFATPVPIASHPAFLGSVEHVFAVRSEEQVLGSHASGHIAGVTDLEAFRDRPMNHLVRETVGDQDLALLSQLSVPRTAGCAGPRPATIGTVHSGPEAFDQSGRALVVGRESGVGASVETLPGPVGCTQALGSHGARATLDGAGLGGTLGGVVGSAQFLGDGPGCASGEGAGASVVLPSPVELAKPFGLRGSVAVDGCALPHAMLVDSVESDGKCDVYDLTVPEHHNFAVAGGIYVHNCDPVETDTYEIHGVQVSNFVLPAWFEPPQKTAGAKYDFLGMLSRPFSLRPGGYAQYLTARGWRSVYGPAVRAHRLARKGRLNRRAGRLLPDPESTLPDMLAATDPRLPSAEGSSGG